MRIDKLLWFLRLAKTRGRAQAMIAAGHIRLNGRRIERAHQAVCAGDVLTLPSPAGARVIRIEALPTRRGPAIEARSCYLALDEAAALPIAPPSQPVLDKEDLQP